MFWSPPKLPVEAPEKEWIEKSFLWLLQTFGEAEFLRRPTMLPNATFFPDQYRGTEDDAVILVRRVCQHMGVDPDTVEVRFMVNRDDTAERHGLPGSTEHSGAAGLYFNRRTPENRHLIALSVFNLNNPTKLVATVAHELGHVLLLGGGKLSPEDDGHEPLTDLLTVFWGLGIFTANASFQFTQWQDHRHHGWRASRLGYLSEEMFGYSLAVYAWLRGETKPAWPGHLAMNVGIYFKRSLQYLEKNGQTSLRRLAQP